MQHLFQLGVDIDFSDNDGYMALHHAVLSGFEDCVQKLINWGSDVNAMTLHGVPLNLAAQKQREHIVSILVSARADMGRAIDFALRHGHDVRGLCELLGLLPIRTTVGELHLLSINGGHEVEEDQLPAFSTVNYEPQESKIDTAPNDNKKRSHPDTDGGNTTKDEGSHAAYSQQSQPARREDSSALREETFARRKGDRRDYMLGAGAFIAAKLLSASLVSGGPSEPWQHTSQDTTPQPPRLFRFDREGYSMASQDTTPQPPRPSRFDREGYSMALSPEQWRSIRPRRGSRDRGEA